MVNSTKAPEKRESVPKGKVTNTEFPVFCSNRGSAGPSERVTTPARECEVELLGGRRIITNELSWRTLVTKTDQENERGRNSPRHQHWPGERDDPRESRESRREGARKGWERENNTQVTCIDGPRARGRRQDVYSSQGNRAEDHGGRFGGADA